MIILKQQIEINPHSQAQWQVAQAYANQNLP